MTSALETSVRKFTADPAAGRIAPKVTATLVGGRAQLSTGPFSWECDLPTAVGGSNQSPSPTAYLLGALAACAVVFVRDTLAPEFDVEATDVNATAGCTADLGGLLGVAGTRSDLGELRVEISITSPSPADRIEALRRAWLARCPIYLALRDANDVAVTFTVARPSAGNGS
ncbi:OsmC family protein [Actinokineospora sp.]|uniref:OsmC family protein n=1 Tax=Actinokineospora sp. TaxID=1872133 RepID=UPI003D6B4E67